MIYFTADTHFHHANIIKHANRPFRDVNEMNNVLIKNWNNVVQPNDTVYHLGDFSFGKPDQIISVLSRLNGHIIFIEGNHDRETRKVQALFHEYYRQYREISINKQNITLCHYAMRVWNKSHHGAWHLYGHSHGTLPDDKNSLSIDVGVDCHKYTPISFDEVAKIMSKKIWKPIDHHGHRN